VMHIWDLLEWRWKKGGLEGEVQVGWGGRDDGVPCSNSGRKTFAFFVTVGP
jgi:hypothetical protein